MGVFSLAAFLLLCLGTLVVPSKGSGEFGPVPASLKGQLMKVVSVVLNKMQGKLDDCRLSLDMVTEASMRDSSSGKDWKITMGYYQVCKNGQNLEMKGNVVVKQVPDDIKIISDESYIVQHRVPGGVKPYAPKEKRNPIDVQDVVKAIFEKLERLPENEGCTFNNRMTGKKTEGSIPNHDTWEVTGTYTKFCDGVGVQLHVEFFVGTVPIDVCALPVDVCISELRQRVIDVEMYSRDGRAIAAPAGYTRETAPYNDEQHRGIMTKALTETIWNDENHRHHKYRLESIEDLAGKVGENGTYWAMILKLTIDDKFSKHVFVEIYECTRRGRDCLEVLGYHYVSENLKPF